MTEMSSSVMLPYANESIANHRICLQVNRRENVFHIRILFCNVGQKLLKAYFVMLRHADFESSLSFHLNFLFPLVCIIIQMITRHSTELSRGRYGHSLTVTHLFICRGLYVIYMYVITDTCILYCTQYTGDNFKG